MSDERVRISSPSRNSCVSTGQSFLSNVAECVQLFKNLTSWDETLAINTDEYVKLYNNFYQLLGTVRFVSNATVALEARFLAFKACRGH